MQAAPGPLISLSPSFNTYSSSDRLAQIAARVVSELTSQDHHQLTHHSDDSWENIYDHHEQEEEKQHHQQQQQQHQNDDVQEEEFEFAFVSRDPNTSPISADEIFFNGQIRPVYPLFNQDLLLSHDGVVSSENVNGDVDAVKNSKLATPKQRRLPLRMLMIEEERETASCSSSEADDLENLPPGTYCVWAPPKASPGRRGGCNKSSSTGSSKRWKFRDLLYRSSSDGKNTFVFLAPSTKSADNNKDGDDVARKRVGGRNGVSQNEERYDVRRRNKAAEEGDKRRSFLPYRQDFVGFFSNVNGLSRNLHPF